MPLALPDLSDALAALVAAAAPAIVTVRSPRAVSSGFHWRPGLVVTAEEALAEEGPIEVAFQDGTTLRADPAGRDATTDVALLRIGRTDAPILPLHAAAPPAGALAIALGARDGQPLAACGIVAHHGPAWRSLRGGEIAARIELDATLHAAAEGGLALDAQGRAFGMVVFGPHRRTLVIPAATIARVAEVLARHGRMPRPYLGLRLQPTRVDAGGRGAIIMAVEPDSPAARSGLHQGDVLAAWDGRPIESIDALLRGLGADRIGTEVALDIRRGGATLRITMTIGERPLS